MGKYFSFLFMPSISNKAKGEAFAEMIINVLFSTLPIWFGGVIYACIAFFSGSDQTLQGFIIFIWNGLLRNVSNGEFLMYAAATLGPTLYLGLSSFRRKEKPFPWVRPQLIIAILINLFATVLFFFARDKGFAPNQPFVFFTTVIYIFCLVLLFPSMAFNHDRRPVMVNDAQTEEQNNFISGYRNHRR